MPFNTIKHGAYYRAQTISNLKFLFPTIPSIDLVTARGNLYIVSTDIENRQTLLHRRRYTRILVPSEMALRFLYVKIARLAMEKTKMMEDGNDAGIRALFEGGMEELDALLRSTPRSRKKKIEVSISLGSDGALDEVVDGLANRPDELPRYTPRYVEADSVATPLSEDETLVES